MNAPGNIKPDNRPYSPSAWKFHTTLMIGETFDEWMGRDWKLRRKAETAKPPQMASAPKAEHEPELKAKNRGFYRDLVYNFVVNEGRPVSNSEITKRLNLSRQTIGKHTQHLAEIGAIIRTEHSRYVVTYEAKP